MGTFEKIKQISPWFFGVFAVLLVLFFTVGDQTVTDAIRQRMSNAHLTVGAVNGISIDRQNFSDQLRETADNQKQAGQQDVDYQQINNQVWGFEVNKALYTGEFEKIGITVNDESVVDIMLEDPPLGIQRYFKNAEGVFDANMYRQLLGDLEGSAYKLIEQSIRAREDYQQLYEQNPEAAEQQLAQMAQEQAGEIILNYRDLFVGYEDSIRNALPFNAYQELVSEAGSVVSPSYAKLQYKMERTAANVNLIAFPLRKYSANEIEVTEKEIEEYYNANKADYIIEKDQVKLDYIVIPFTSLRADSAKSINYVTAVATMLNEADSADIVQTYSNIFTKYFGVNRVQNSSSMSPIKANVLKALPTGEISKAVVIRDTTYFFRLDDIATVVDTTVTARHILLSFEADEKDSIKALADNLISQIKAGADFAELAKKYSSDGSASKGGDLGEFGRGQMVGPFENACFNKVGKNGLVAEPVETQFGYHIIDVTDSKVEMADSTARIITYAEIKFSPEISQSSMNSFKRQGRDIAKRLANGEIPDSLAKELNLIANTTGYIEKGKSLTISQPEWITNRFFADTAFVAEKGTVLNPRSFEKCLVVVQVADKKVIGEYSNLEEVSTKCKNAIIQEKQKAMAKADAEKAFAKVKIYPNLIAAKAADSLLAVSEIPNFRSTASIPQVGRDMLLSAKVLNGGSAKMAIVEGSAAWYIVEVNDAKMPTDAQVDEGYVTYVPTLFNKAKPQVFNRWYQSLRDGAEIDDYRYRYYFDY